MMIIFSGFPGCGKVLTHLCLQKNNAVYLRIDTIEHAILESENGDKNLDPTGHFVACTLTRENLRAGPTNRYH